MRAGIAGELEDFIRDLTPLVGQGEVAGFLDDVEDARKLNSLAEGVRGVELFIAKCLRSAPNFFTTRYL